MRTLSFFLGLGGIGLACGGASTPDFGEGGTGGDGQATGDGSMMGDGSTGDGSIGMCPNGNFPMYDKGCTSTDNCSFGLHQVSCCGTLSAIGFNHAYKTQFDSAEMTWRASCPGCGCPAGPTTTESGMTCDMSKIGVKCVMGSGSTTGKCQTFCN